MEKKGVFEVLPIDDIIIDKEFNVYAPVTGELFDVLTESLSQTGQLHPVIINKVIEDNLESTYHLVAGEQRVRALMEDGAKTIECKVFEDMTELEKAEVSIIENEQRRTPSPMDQARGMSRLRQLGRSTRKIADLYGVSDDTVIRREKLLELEPDVQKMIERPINPLPIHQAAVLVGLSKSDQLQLARKIAPKVGPIMGEREARELVDNHTNGPKLPLKKEPPAAKEPPQTSDPRPKTQDPGPQSQEPQAKTPGKQSKHASSLKPVKGLLSISGKFEVAESTLVYVRSATITVKVDDSVKILQCANFQIDFPEDSDNLKDLTKLIKRHQPAKKEKSAKKPEAAEGTEKNGNE